MATVSPRRDARRSTVLLVESDADHREMYAERLRTRGFTVLTADTTVIVTDSCVRFV
jgi:DNA-binding response OmpR family regulator